MEEQLRQMLEAEDDSSLSTGNIVFRPTFGEQLLLTAYKAYVEKKGLYSYENVSTAPQNKFRPNGKPKQLIIFGEKRNTAPANLTPKSREHNQWLFFATGTDRRGQSDQVYRRHAELYSDEPGIYHGEATRWNVSDLAALFKQYGIHMENQTAKHWIGQSATLFHTFNGDPIQLLKRCGETVEGVIEMKKVYERTGLFPWDLKRVKRVPQRSLFKHGDPLPGYGPKITSLFCLFMAEVGELKMPDDAFPVDLHVQRIFLQNEVIQTVGHVGSQQMEKLLRPFICLVCRRHKLDKVHLAHALWQLGSKLCVWCHVRKDYGFQCPVVETCLGSVVTDSYFAKNESRGWVYPLTFRPPKFKVMQNKIKPVEEEDVFDSIAW